MIMNPNDKYLFWFEAKQDEEVISDLTDKLNKLGVQAQIINGVMKPAIIQFGNKPVITNQQKPVMVKQ